MFTVNINSSQFRFKKFSLVIIAIGFLGLIACSRLNL